MPLVLCTKCSRTVVVRSVVRFTSTLGTRKVAIPENCWVTGKCKEKTNVQEPDDRARSCAHDGCLRKERTA